MRKTLSFYENKTLAIQSSLLPLSFVFYTLFHCDLESMVKGRMYPCIRIGILLNSPKYYMSVLVPVSVVLVPFTYGAFLFGGTGTIWPLLNSCLGVPIPICLVPVPVPLHLFPSIIALPKTSPQRLPSSSMIHIRSLDPNTCNNYA